MNALKPRPPFQVLVMSEESRLGREQIETAHVLKQIMDSGVRVFFYLEDRERTLDTAIEKVMLGLTSFAAEMERERAQQRTRDAMKRMATRSPRLPADGRSVRSPPAPASIRHWGMALTKPVT